MGTPYFQQQSAAYTLCQKQELHLFTPDGQRHRISPSGKSAADYANEVQDHLVQFEVESLLAQRDSLRDALARRYLLQNFGVAGEACFAGADLDSVLAELKRRGLAPTPVKNALRTALSRANSEIKDVWPIRESGRNLQYTSYDLTFTLEELATPAKRQKIWNIVADWAAKCRLPGKEGARLATVQDWEELEDGWALRVDLHHYPRPDMEGCRPIALLDATERNKDMEILRKALARSGVELDELAVKPYAVPQNFPAHDPLPPPVAAAPAAPPQRATTILSALEAVRIERDRMELQLQRLNTALADGETRQQQATRIGVLEQEKSALESMLKEITATLDSTVWPDRPGDLPQADLKEKIRRFTHAFELRQTALATSLAQLSSTRDKLSSATSTAQKLEPALIQLEEQQKALELNTKSLQIAQSELRLLTQRLRIAEKERDGLREQLSQTQQSRDEWQDRAENAETTLKAELLKQHNAALLAQELDFTRQIQEMQHMHMNLMQETQQEHVRKLQQERDHRLRQIEEIQQEHIRHIQDLQATHLRQIQKLRRLAPHQENDDGWNSPQPGLYIPRHIATATATPPSRPPLALEPENAPATPALSPEVRTVASELGQYQAESREIFDNRIGEYLRIAKDMGLSEADKWLLAEARKLAEARARQGELGI